jgi:hypothetical protein
MPLPQLGAGAMMVGAAAVPYKHKSTQARGASLTILLIHYCNNKKYMLELLYVIFRFTSLLPYFLMAPAI